jgi:GT2 family glycosyltransferase
MKKILLITVNYNNAAVTLNLLDKLLDTGYPEESVIAVVDNSQPENEFRQLREWADKHADLNVKIFRTGNNTGYFGAAGFVLNEMDFKADDFEYVIIANNDVLIDSPDFWNILESMETDAAVIAPQIYSVSGHKFQNPHRMSPVTKWQKFQYRLLFTGYTLAFVLYHARKLMKSFKQRKVAPQAESLIIYSAHGAFMIFTRQYFRSGGVIDHGYFLYGEEDSVAAQCALFGLTIQFEPALKIRHLDHVSTGGSGFKKRIYSLQKNAYRYILKNYPGFYS